MIECRRKNLINLKICIVIVIIYLCSTAFLFADEIYLTDGGLIKCKVEKITVDEIFYYPEDSDKKDLVKREKAAKIVYSDGKIIRISGDKISPNPGKQKHARETKNQDASSSSGYQDSILVIGVIAGIGTEKSEELDQKENRALYSAFSTDFDSIEYSKDLMGIELDFMLPSFKFYQHREFNFTGIKFGIKSRFSYNIIDQQIEFQLGADTISRKDEFLEYKCLGIGPTVDFIFSPRQNYFNIIIHTYSSFGYLFDGNLSAVPALRESGVDIRSSDYSTKLKGYSATIGSGLHFVINQTIPYIIGINLEYSYSKLELDKTVTVYQDGDKNISIKGWALGLYFGIHIF